VRKSGYSLPPSERSLYGATATLVDKATERTRVVAYTGMTTVEACQEIAAECDRLGPSWRVRTISNPITIMADLRYDGGRSRQPPEPRLLGLIDRNELLEYRLGQSHDADERRIRRAREWRGETG
jgi:hypothetical protein